MRLQIPSASALALAALLAACSGEKAAERPDSSTPEAASPSPDDAALAARAKTVFGVLPEKADHPDNPITEAKVALGRALYYDTRLSKNHDLSCNSCHALDRFGVDGAPTSTGHKGQKGNRNAPTVYNAAIHVAQFWDGRAKDVEEQAKGPVTNPVEMAMPDEARVNAVLRSIPGYRPMFEAAFPGEKDPVDFDHAAQAIAAFERTLLTPSRFDQFVAGKHDALTAEEKAGLKTFMDVGCITCHMGPGIGGSMYQKLGLVKPYETQDLGRFEVTGNEADRHVFKVPSLRNVARTGPYFHDGSVATLEEAVRLMADHQLGKELTDAQVREIVAFLNALTGEVDPARIARPELPESGPDTPKPDPT